MLERFGDPVEAIADPWLGCDQFRIVGVGFDLLSQIADEYSEIVHLIAVVGTPNRLQEFTVSDGFVRVAG